MFAVITSVRVVSMQSSRRYHLSIASHYSFTVGTAPVTGYTREHAQQGNMRWFGAVPCLLCFWAHTIDHVTYSSSSRTTNIVDFSTHYLLLCESLNPCNNSVLKGTLISPYLLSSPACRRHARVYAPSAHHSWV